MSKLKKQILSIPIGTEYSANRYDTDNEHKLHLWDNKGNSFDISFKKQKPEKGEHILIK